MHPLEGLDIREFDKKLQHAPTASLAWKIINEYYAYYGKDEAPDSLWAIVADALTSDDDGIDNHKRGNMIFFYEYTRALLRAVYVLHKKHPNQFDGYKEKEE